MDSSFDPYGTWLGIPRNQRPPTLYRLLGVEHFESRPAIISAAAGQLLARIDAQLAGPHGQAAQQIRHEIEFARSVLLDPAQKARYDGQWSGGGSAASQLDPAESAAQMRRPSPRSQPASMAGPLPMSGPLPMTGPAATSPSGPSGQYTPQSNLQSNPPSNPPGFPPYGAPPPNPYLPPPGYSQPQQHAPHNGPPQQGHPPAYGGQAGYSPQFAPQYPPQYSQPAPQYPSQPPNYGAGGYPPQPQMAPPGPPSYAGPGAHAAFSQPGWSPPAQYPPSPVPTLPPQPRSPQQNSPSSIPSYAGPAAAPPMPGADTKGKLPHAPSPVEGHASSPLPVRGDPVGAQFWLWATIGTGAVAVMGLALALAMNRHGADPVALKDPPPASAQDRTGFRPSAATPRTPRSTNVTPTPATTSDPNAMPPASIMPTEVMPTVATPAEVGPNSVTPATAPAIPGGTETVVAPATPLVPGIAPAIPTPGTTSTPAAIPSAVPGPMAVPAPMVGAPLPPGTTLPGTTTPETTPPGVNPATPTPESTPMPGATSIPLPGTTPIPLPGTTPIPLPGTSPPMVAATGMPPTVSAKPPATSAKSTEVVELPNWEESSSVGARPFTLASLPAGVEQNIELRLPAGDALAGRTGSRFQLSRSATNDGTLAWQVDLIDKENKPLPVARLAAAQQQLQFNWISGGDPITAQRLRNGRIEIEAGGETKSVGLRKTADAAPITFQFEGSQVKLPLAGLPEAADIGLEIIDTTDGVPVHKIEPAGRANVGREVEISFLDEKSQKVFAYRVVLLRPSGSQLRLDSRALIYKGTRSASVKTAEIKTELDNVRQQKINLETQYAQFLDANRRNRGLLAQAAQVHAAQLQALDMQISKLEQLSTLSDDLDGKASFEYRVVARVGNEEIELVRSRAAGAAAPGAAIPSAAP